MKVFKSFVEDIPSFEIFADKGYTSIENNALLEQLGKKSRIMKKAARNRPLKQWEKVFNRLVSHHGTVAKRLDQGIRANITGAYSA